MAPHYNVTYPCPPFSPDPQDLGLILIHPPVEFHALQLVIDTEDNTPSLSPLPVLPKGSITFYSNTPVIEGILPCLHDANETIVLLACAHL